MESHLFKIICFNFLQVMDYASFLVLHFKSLKMDFEWEKKEETQQSVSKIATIILFSRH